MWIIITSLGYYAIPRDRKVYNVGLLEFFLPQWSDLMGKLEDDVRYRIKDLYGSVAEFARQMKIPYSTINNLLNRGIAGGGVETVLPIFKALGLDANALNEKKVVETDADPDYINVPLYGSIAAGIPIDMLPIEDYFPVPKPVAEKYPDGFLLKVVGESMNRRLPNLSYAFINPTDEATDGKAYAVCVNGHAATIKRVHVLNNGFELVPDSNDPTFKPTVYDYGVEGTESVTIIGRVVYYVVPFDFEI
jgi:repressor LexA